MSYNYDINPWDDNYTTASSQQNNSANTNNNNNNNNSNYNYGYSAQNVGGDNYNSNYGHSDNYGVGQQYQFQDQQYSSPDQQQLQQQQKQQEGVENFNDGQQQQLPQQDSSNKSQPSFISRFLRQHIPFCGPFMDTISNINLPFIDALVQHINRDLLISKIFYFFFYSAFGSLFPLMGVYFKQLGMNPAQVGILTGVRPFIEIFSAPFWHSLAERFHKSKALLLFSLLSWIVFTYSLAHIRPPASACVAFNDSEFLLYTPYSANDLSNYDIGNLESQNNFMKPMSEEGGNEMFMNKPPLQQKVSFNDKEGEADAILASEENQNDQKRKRRRKRRQISNPENDYYEKEFEENNNNNNNNNDDDDDDIISNNNMKKLFYSINTNINNNDNLQRFNYDDLNVGLNLDNDFDDKLLISNRGVDNGEKVKQTLSFFQDRDIVDSSNFNDNKANNAKPKVIQDNNGGLRYKRSMIYKDVDDLLGESDEPEPEEERIINQQQQQKPKSKQINNNYEEEDSEQEEEESGDNNKRPQQVIVTSAPQSTTTTTTLATTSSSSTDEMADSQFNNAGESGQQQQQQKSRRVYKQRHKTPPTHIVGMSPITVEYAANYNKEKHSQFVTPMFSTIVYKLDDIKEVFFLLLLLISLGEFFSAPALTLADSATLSYLGDNTDLYGRQRLFGSLSWAITLLLVGMALDNATSIADHPCGPHPRERSYTVCFAIFSLLMACALLTATQFRFTYPKANSNGGGNNNQALIVASTTDSKTVVTKTIDGSTVDDLYASTQPRSIFNTAPPVNAPPPNVTDGQGKEKFEFLDKWKSAVFAQNTKELPQWINVFRQFKNSLHLTYLFITWFLGCGVGLVFTFLFWHLQDVGGTPTLFGICSVINHISEIFAYFFSFSLIKRFGHTKVLSFGLGCNVIRFLYVAFLTNPYYALPFELVQGITHAACFAACCSYISHVSKPELRTSTQGVMQGLHHGIGRACGTLIGGYMINAIGSRASFCIYGLLSGCVLAGFLYVRKKASEMKDEEVKVDDSEALGGYGAPQGVPSAIPVSTQQDIDYQW